MNVYINTDMKYNLLDDSFHNLFVLEFLQVQFSLPVILYRYQFKDTLADFFVW